MASVHVASVLWLDGSGLDGSVRNLGDGSVELVAGGPRQAVESLLDWCRTGPPGARVDSVTVLDARADPEGEGRAPGPGFEILG